MGIGASQRENRDGRRILLIFVAEAYPPPDKIWKSLVGTRSGHFHFLGMKLQKVIIGYWGIKAAWEWCPKAEWHRYTPESHRELIEWIWDHHGRGALSIPSELSAHQLRAGLSL